MKCVAAIFVHQSINNSLTGGKRVIGKTYFSHLRTHIQIKMNFVIYISERFALYIGAKPFIFKVVIIRVH